MGGSSSYHRSLSSGFVLFTTFGLAWSAKRTLPIEQRRMLFTQLPVHLINSCGVVFGLGNASGFPKRVFTAYFACDYRTRSISRHTSEYNQIGDHCDEEPTVTVYPSLFVVVPSSPSFTFRLFFFN